MSRYNPNDIFDGRYLLLEKIGIGGFSEIWKAVDQMTEDTELAIKIYAPERGVDEYGLKQFRREYAVVLNLSHPSLLTARHFDIWNDSPYLVMPFIEGGSVYSRLMEKGPFEEKDIAEFIAQMAAALEFLHENDVLHQDIKPDNILINRRGKYLLTDFGISSRLRNSLRKSTSTAKEMTVAYAPPERFRGGLEAGPEGDIFSLGVLLYELAIGDVPWMGAGGIMVKADSEPLELGDDHSKRFKNLVQACVRFNPAERPSATTLKAWANWYQQNGAWPEIPKIQGENKDTPLQGRSTQRIDTPPASEAPIKEMPAVEEQFNRGNVPVKNKKNRTRAIVVIGAIAIACIFLFSLDALRGSEQADSGIPSDTSALPYDSALTTLPVQHYALDPARSNELNVDALFNKENIIVDKIRWNGAFELNQKLLALTAPISLTDTLAVWFREGDAHFLAEVVFTKMNTIPPPPAPVEVPSVTIVPEEEEEEVLVRAPAGWFKDVYGDEYSYSGELRNGKPQGFGVATFTNGDIYKGNFEDGYRSGHGIYTFKSEDVYYGQWQNDRYQGKGRMTKKDGSYYEGNYASGKKQGYGVYKWVGGESYEGEWNLGKKEGKGTYTWTTGYKYVGDWKQDKKDGKGKYTWPSGNTYEGSFVNGFLEGEGVFIAATEVAYCPGSKKHVGYWKNDKREGPGKCYDKNGKLIYEGEFSDNKPVGQYPNR